MTGPHRYRCMACGNHPTRKIEVRGIPECPADYRCAAHPDATLLPWPQRYDFAWYYLSQAYYGDVSPELGPLTTVEAMDEFVRSWDVQHLTITQDGRADQGVAALVWEYLKMWPKHWPPPPMPKISGQNALYGTGPKGQQR